MDILYNELYSTTSSLRSWNLMSRDDFPPIGNNIHDCTITEDILFRTTNSIQQLAVCTVGSWCVGTISLQLVPMDNVHDCTIAEDRRFHATNSIQQLAVCTVGSWWVGPKDLQLVPMIMYKIFPSQKIDYRPSLVFWSVGINIKLITRHNWAMGMDFFLGCWQENIPSPLPPPPWSFRHEINDQCKLFSSEWSSKYSQGNPIHA